MSNIIDVLHFAATGLSQQQQAIAGNLANSETPGYTAQDVNFQSSLQQALTAPAGATASITTSPDPAAPATNGNNVDTSHQLVAAQQAELSYQTTVEMLNAQFRLIAGASGGSWT